MSNWPDLSGRVPVRPAFSEMPLIPTQLPVDDKSDLPNRVQGDGRAPWTGTTLEQGEDGMNAKRACLVALVITLAGAGAASAQQYAAGAVPGPGVMQPALLPAPGAATAKIDGAVPPPTGPRLSDYILGTKPDCCGPLGGDGSIGTEIYVRTGLSVPLQSGFFGHTLTDGWSVAGGGRALFFNTDYDAAWTADFGISNVHDNGQHSDRKAFLSLFFTDPNTGITSKVPFIVTVRSLNLTFANFALGREWYLWAPAATCRCGHVGDETNWRVGFDAGARWGSAKLELHEIRHRTEVVEGAFIALHSDLEVPYGGWLFVLGGRIEWDNTWMHTLLQDTPENLQSINLLMTAGVRY
jgi:hypothetical protein